MDPYHVQGIRPLDANRAMLFVLVVPNLFFAFFAAFASPGVAIALGSLATLIFLFVVFREAMALLVNDPWLRTPPRLGVILGTTLLAFFASRGVLAFMASVAPELLEQTLPYEPPVGVGLTFDVAMAILGIAVLVPLYEELVFRGLALRAYGRVRSYLFAAVFTSILFALLHVMPAQVFAILPLGFILARAVQAAGSFWTAVIVHILNNGLAIGLLVYLSNVGASLEELAPQEEVPLATGLFGLAIAALCLWLAGRWFKVPEEPGKSGPLWSASLWLVMLFSGANLLAILFGVHPLQR